MLGSNTDGNLFLNYAEFLNWMVATSDGCLTVTDVMGLELYGALFPQIACTCNDYPTPESPQLQLPCVSCDDDSASDAAVIALPGVYPANVYPGAYTVDACRSLLAVIDDLCVDGAVVRLEPTRSPVVVVRDATTAPVAVSTSTGAPVTFPPSTTAPTAIATTQTPTAAPTQAPVVVPAPPPVTAVPTTITTTETPTAAPLLSIVDTTPSTSPTTDSPLVAESSPPPSVTKPTIPSTTVVDTPTTNASGTGDDAAGPLSDRNIDSEANAVEDDNEDDNNNNRKLKIVLSCLLVWAFFMFFALYVLRVRKESQARRAQFWRRDGSFPTTIPSDTQPKKRHYRDVTEWDGDASSMENGSAPPRQLRESSVVTFEQQRQHLQQQTSVESSLSSQTYDKPAPVELMIMNLVVPADVERQMDEVHEAAPFKSSTVRFQEDVEAIEAVAASEEDDSDEDDNDDDSESADEDSSSDSSSITATEIATSSSLSQQLDALEAEQQQQQQDSTAAPDVLLGLSDSNDHEDDGALVPSSSDSSLIHMFTDDASVQEGAGDAADAAAAAADGTKDQGRRQEEEYRDLLQALDSMFASEPAPSAPPKE